MSDAMFDEAFGFGGSSSSSRNFIPETQNDPDIVQGIEQVDAANAMLNLKPTGCMNEDGY